MTTYRARPAHIVPPADRQEGPATEAVPLTTGNPVLDGFIGPFEPSTVTLIDSAHPFVFDLAVRICVRTMAELGQEVVFVDGGNSFDPYSVLTHARWAGVQRSTALDSIRVARAFTAYQMTALLHDMLEKEVASPGRCLGSAPRTLVVSCIPDLYLDGDIWKGESLSLFRRSIERVRALTREHDLVTILTSFGLSKLTSIKGLKRLAYSSVDRVIRMERGAGPEDRPPRWGAGWYGRRGTKGGMNIILPGRDKRMWFKPAPRDQRVLEEFTDNGGAGRG